MHKTLFISFILLFLAIHIQCQEEVEECQGDEECQVSCPESLHIATINEQELTFAHCCFSTCEPVCDPNSRQVCIYDPHCEGDNCYFNGNSCQECANNFDFYVARRACPEPTNPIGGEEESCEFFEEEEYYYSCYTEEFSEEVVIIDDDL